MRMVRTAATALVAIALIPGLLAAQDADASAKRFQDSWFWGLHTGAMMFSAGVDQETKVTAPTIGAEWFITRSRLALRLSVEQAFFDEQAGVFDATVAGAVRPVNVSDWRRYAAEMYFFASPYRGLRPYAGFGVAIHALQDAAPEGSFTTAESLDSVFTAVHRLSSRASAVFSAGAQMEFGRTAAFLQASAMPTRNSFLFSRSQYTTMLSAGVRYNFGSAIEKF